MYRRILAAIDREDEAGTDLIAERCALLSGPSEAKIFLVHVRIHVSDAYNRHLPWNWEADQVQEAKSWLQELAGKHDFEGSLAGVHAPAGPVAREVTRIAAEERADLIVIAAHEMTLGRIILGSNAHAITRDAHCDVLVVK